MRDLLLFMSSVALTIGISNVMAQGLRHFHFRGGSGDIGGDGQQGASAVSGRRSGWLRTLGKRPSAANH